MIVTGLQDKEQPTVVCLQEVPARGGDTDRRRIALSGATRAGRKRQSARGPTELGTKGASPTASRRRRRKKRQTLAQLQRETNALQAELEDSSDEESGGENSCGDDNALESEDGESEDNEGLQKRRMLGQTGGHALASKPAGLP
jgi:hypothetical protein